MIKNMTFTSSPNTNQPPAPTHPQNKEEGETWRTLTCSFFTYSATSVN